MRRMLNSFNNEIKNALIENIDIQELAGKLSVERRGNLYRCINPMHKDDTPSLKLYNETNSFYCFGCKTGGDIIKFYQIANNVDFQTAVKELATYCGLNYNNYSLDKNTSNIAKSNKTNISIKPAIKRLDKSRYKFLCEYDKYYFDECAGIIEFERGLDTDMAAEAALMQVKTDRLERNKIIFEELFNYCDASGLDDKVYNYLVKGRRLSEVLIKKNKIFSLNDIPSITKRLISLFDIRELNGSGLFKDGKLIFKDSHRLIIPYLQDGSIIYLRSRYFDRIGNSKTDKLKYYGLLTDSLNLNTVKRFYNVDTLKQINIHNKIYLTEGELDCLTIETIGLYSIAIPGVSSIPEEAIIKLLEDFQIVICFDNDKSGYEATQHIIKIFKKLKLGFSTISLPHGIKDVNEFLINQLNEER